MDVSFEYVKMCEKAEEIQELDIVGFNEKDFYTIRNDVFYHEGLGYQDIDRDIIRLKEYPVIWLPRQDQLQEMVCPSSLWNLNHRFSKWLYDVDDDGDIDLHVRHEHLDFKSMEQLWLAFILSEKYNKVWDGEDWKTR